MQEDAEHHDGSYQEGELKKVEQDLTVDALRESDERHWFTGGHGRCWVLVGSADPQLDFPLTLVAFDFDLDEAHQRQNEHDSRSVSSIMLIPQSSIIRVVGVENCAAAGSRAGGAVVGGGLGWCST